MKDTIHLIQIPFTGLGLQNGYRGDEWLRHRIEIFKNYTLKSLLNQTEKRFVTWLCFREKEKTNLQVIELFAYLTSLNFPVIFTFGGIVFWDDKYPNDNLLERLKITLPELKNIVGNKKYVYETILASDDMYHKDAFKTIQQQEFREQKALVHWKGFILNQETGQLAEWKPIENHLPPFYTIMYPADVFMNPEKHFEYMKGYKSHEDIERLFDCVKLPDYRYCVVTHGKNISTTWQWHRLFKLIRHPFIGREFKGEKKEKWLREFGVI